MSAVPQRTEPTWDSLEWRDIRDENLLRWLNGNREAADTVVALSTISETWDDLVDLDNVPDKTRINEAFTLALVGLHVNEFYKLNEHLFYALTVVAINAWMDANELVKSPILAKRQLAFHLRNFGHEITMMAVFRACGWERLREVSLEVRDFWGHEDFASWDKNERV